MRLLYLAFIPFMLLASCEFQPEGEVFTEVARPDAGWVSVEIPAAKNDTLFLHLPAYISYRSIIGENRLKNIRISVNGTELASNAEQAGLFSFYTPNYSDGIYKLLVELTVYVNSSSLAGLKDMEEASFKKEFIVVVDRSAPNPVPITSIVVKNGLVQVQWAKYNRKNFEKYELSVFYYNPHRNEYEFSDRTFIYDPDATSFADSTFLGGKVKYAISVTGAGQASAYTEQSFEVPYTPQLTFKWINNDRIELTWNKPPCYASLKSYNISTYDDGTFAHVFGSSIVNDTTTIVRFNEDIGFYINYQLTIIPYKRNYNNNTKSSAISVSRGEPFPWNQETTLTFNTALQKYFMVKDNFYQLVISRIGQANLEEQKLTLSHADFALSSNGMHCYWTEGAILSRVDPLTFSTISSIDLRTYSPISGGWYISVSNNNILTASTFSETIVVDLNHATLITKLPADPSTLISPDGKYIHQSGKIYALEAGTYVEKMTVPQNYKAVFVDSDRLLLDVLRTILVIDLNTYTIVNTILIEGVFGGYDPVSGLAYSTTDEYDVLPPQMFLYKLDQKEAVKSIPAAGCKLINNSLISDQLITPLSYYYP